MEKKINEKETQKWFCVKVRGVWALVGFKRDDGYTSHFVFYTDKDIVSETGYLSFFTGQMLDKSEDYEKMAKEIAIMEDKKSFGKIKENSLSAWC